MEGARNAQERFDDPDLKYNECYQYAVIRNILYNKMNKTTEILVKSTPAGKIPLFSLPSLSPYNCFHHSVK